MAPAVPSRPQAADSLFPLPLPAGRRAPFYRGRRLFTLRNFSFL